MRFLGYLCNAGLRLFMLAILGEALRKPEDPRYRGKAIGTRGLVMIPLSLVVPIKHAVLRGGSRPYPVWTDNLWLSIFALDLLGNHFDLYDRYRYFDALPHAHGTGAATIVAAELGDLPVLSAVGAAQIGHIALEAQEYYSDVCVRAAQRAGHLGHGQRPAGRRRRVTDLCRAAPPVARPLTSATLQVRQDRLAAG